MTSDERSRICAELRQAASAWRNLKQSENNYYIGKWHDDIPCNILISELLTHP
jgi:hypothetical protein